MPQDGNSAQNLHAQILKEFPWYDDLLGAWITLQIISQSHAWRVAPILKACALGVPNLELNLTLSALILVPSLPLVLAFLPLAVNPTLPPIVVSPNLRPIFPLLQINPTPPLLQANSTLPTLVVNLTRPLLAVIIIFLSPPAIHVEE
ncbi:hypothetical protein P692DRAFT_20876866 [Suillus brevipes Sb2]|nr:hypothetical protein P692DRAFT_20876866 [Suillus brevipes Sb2]